MKKENFSERLKFALEIKGVKAIELSRMTGIPKSAISQYIHGNFEAKQNRVSIISQALHISPAWLMGYDVPMTEHTETNTIPTNKQELIDKIVAMPDDQFQRFQMLLQTFEEISKND